MWYRRQLAKCDIDDKLAKCDIDDKLAKCDIDDTLAKCDIDDKLKPPRWCCHSNVLQNQH